VTMGFTNLFMTFPPLEPFCRPELQGRNGYLVLSALLFIRPRLGSCSPPRAACQRQTPNINFRISTSFGWTG
jgi:hypothetical protein